MALNTQMADATVNAQAQTTHATCRRKLTGTLRFGRVGTNNTAARGRMTWTS